MTFNSIEYILFFPLTFILYWFIFNRSFKLLDILFYAVILFSGFWISPITGSVVALLLVGAHAAIQDNLKRQNFLILIASYVFYGWWSFHLPEWWMGPVFLGLLMFTSTIDYIMGRLIDAEKEKKRKFLWLCISWGLNLVLFGYFKYLNFFIDAFIDAFSILGIHLNRTTLNIILPIGISFYTLQSLGYTIDVYRGHVKPAKDYITFLSFVAFFPQLLAGPIERAPNLLHQFYTPRKFNFELARDGMRQTLWGMFKKIVVADNFAPYVNDIFANYSELGGVTLYFGWVLFSVQLYCDFAGYSDIAVGTGKLFGFQLMRNFKNPFFSPNPQDFWKRWHISLSSWFRDYVYMYMFGLKKTTNMMAVAMIITFTISGLWHGANWNFVLWGFLNGVFIAIYLIFFKKYRKIIFGEGHLIPSLKEFVMIAITYNAIAFSLVMFRAPDIQVVFGYYHQFFTHLFDPIQWGKIVFVIPMTAFVLLEWTNRHKVHPLENLSGNVFWRWFVYFVMTVFIVIEMGKPTQNFIYFQF